jgi:hypothetical protein
MTDQSYLYEDIKSKTVGMPTWTERQDSGEVQYRGVGLAARRKRGSAVDTKGAKRDVRRAAWAFRGQYLDTRRTIESVLWSLATVFTVW